MFDYKKRKNYRVFVSLFVYVNPCCLFVILNYLCPSSDISKIIKQGCGLARKGHGNVVNEMNPAYSVRFVI